MLVAFSEEQQLPEVGTVTAEDQMDDGTPIRVLLLCATTCRDCLTTCRLRTCLSNGMQQRMSH